MIPPEELEVWARLYDLGHQNFDPFSEEAQNARRELDRLLRDRYPALFPGRTVTFYKFKSEAIRRMKAFLKRA
jgi:hypothetical protein